MNHIRQYRRRRGLTLTELLIAGTIMTLLAGGMGTLVMTVHATNDFCRGQAVAAQHARVALERIQRTVHAATANEEFPGCLVLSESASGYDFPDALVVWSRGASPTLGQNQRPLVGELTIFCLDPVLPSRLIEVRDPGNTTQCPLTSDLAAWAALVDGLKVNAASKNLLTDRIRTASPAIGGGGDLRGCVRFEILMAPSHETWSDFRETGVPAWEDLDWPLDFYNAQHAVRRVVCQTELQILPGDATSAPAGVPFFGSATLTYDLIREDLP